MTKPAMSILAASVAFVVGKGDVSNLLAQALDNTSCKQSRGGEPTGFGQSLRWSY